MNAATASVLGPQQAGAAPNGTVQLPPPPPRPAGPAGWLDLNPLSPFAAIVPLTVVAAVTLDLRLPAGVAALAAALALVLNPRRGAVLVPAVAAMCTVLALGLAVAVAPPVSETATFHFLFLHLTPTQLNIGAQLGVRLAAVIYLVLNTALLSSPTQALIASVQHLKLPLRIAGAGMAAIGLGRVLRQQHLAIRQAHLLRGSRLDWPVLGPIARWVRSAPALVAAAVRHAERVSMSMDARSFGAHRSRTEFYTPRWRWLDSLLLLVLWGLGAGAAWLVRAQGFSLFPTYVS
ncbi:MAG: energy-coupling factor transporter transmembrane component T [Buchananella hordeovulneris]|nr:energy-coupling factor transporter transmembrane component T [Buchananella hordeovulneris]